MNYSAIRIEGSIISGELLDRIDDILGQTPADFGFGASAKVKDEIARSWADAQDYWRIFRRKLETLRADSPATSETRNQWIVPLLGLLGYQMEYQNRATEVNQKSYQISHRVVNRAGVPVHIVGWNDPSGLDRKAERARGRMSAHAMLQEFLNLDEHLYGIATNGAMLRLLRDSSRLVKLTYVEFDLDRIFSDGLFADFAIFYRLLHASRLPVSADRSHECLLEAYHEETLEQGTRIRDGLRSAVTQTLQEFGNGFLRHLGNTRLREELGSGGLRPTEYFALLLRLVYRLLFVMVIEERGLLFPKGTPQKFVQMYYRYYSVQRLRRLSGVRGLRSDRFHDGWMSLIAVFRIFEKKKVAGAMNLSALGGWLFDERSIGMLSESMLANDTFYRALEQLCVFVHPDSGQRMPVNFGALATEEFGSIYESLLELHPVVEAGSAPMFGFRQAAGNDRKTTGSYYTPQGLVVLLLDSALEPSLDDRVRRFRELGYASVDDAILHFTVCDPACGSGHFLIAAAQRIARRLAVHRAGEEEPSPDVARRALRDVIGHCLFGVDINPMSIELCKIRLWLEAVEPGSPLNFLDHHIKCGNSLLGANPALLKDGIPDEAYAPIVGDTKEAATWMKKLNREAKAITNQESLFANADPWNHLGNLPAAIAHLDEVDDTDVDVVRKKEEEYRRIIESMSYNSATLVHDAWCAAFVWPKSKKEYGYELTTEHVRKIEHNPYGVAPAMREQIRSLAGDYRFFHWHLEFPQIFDAEGNGGFDIILGNPPWERVKLAEKEWFAERDSTIANAANSVSRKKLIDQLLGSKPELLEEFRAAQRSAEGESHVLRNSGTYPLCGRGDINLYAVFAELMRQKLATAGVMGVVLPSGIATDDTTKYYFQDIATTRSLVSLFDFENRKKLFAGVHSSYKFCVFTAGSGKAVPAGRSESAQAEFVFFAHSVEDVEDTNRRFTLSTEDIALLNPNTLTCPIFRTRRDAEITKAIYRRVPVLIREGKNECNQWGVKFNRHIDMANDSDLFRTSEELESANWERIGNSFVQESTAPGRATVRKRMLPLYEAKMVHQFDHRWATYAPGGIEDVTVENKQNT